MGKVPLYIFISLALHTFLSLALHIFLALAIHILLSLALQIFLSLAPHTSVVALLMHGGGNDAWVSG